jgi:hypothetical protein
MTKQEPKYINLSEYDVEILLNALAYYATRYDDTKVAQDAIKHIYDKIGTEVVQ